MKLTENVELTEEYRKKAAALVAQMTLDEKVGQTLHSAPAIDRLGIRAYNWWTEALHGVARAGIATVFPQAIGMAATFDADLLRTVGDAVSTEGRAKYNMQSKYNDRDIYKGLTFWAPNVNIFRDPRWGRGHETYGEDPYLTSRLGVAYINGIQGDDDKHLKAAACAKHFAVHSGPEDLRHRFNAVCSKQDLYETYLPAFKAAVCEASVEVVMGAYNRTNGEPCCGSKTLLQDILRKEWGFKGHVTSDCWAIKDFHEGHHVTDGPVESVAMAMNNGCDLNCGNIYVYLKEAVEAGLVPESRIDEALTNLYTTRMKLGVMGDDNGSKFDDIPYTEVDSDKHRKLNLSVSQKSVVLLRNQNILPLDKSSLKTIAVVGPNADNRRALVGNYEGTASRYVTVLEGIEDYVGDDVRVLTSQGCHLCLDKVENLAQSMDRFAETRAVCEEADVVVCVVGLDSGLEGEEGDQGNVYASGDKRGLELPGLQNELLRVCVESGKPVIVVVLSGSALDLSYADENAAAVLQGWYPGAYGGRAIANILFGDACPEGKLPITFYRNTEDLPDFTDYSMEGRTYRYMKKEALYPFGFGLSYADFEYSNLSIKSEKLGQKGAEINFDVTNVGKRDATETVEIYVKALPELNIKHVPNTSLKYIVKASLAAGETRNISVSLPLEAFSLFDENGRAVVYKGTFEISVGGTQPDSRSEALMGRKTKRILVSCVNDILL